MANTFSIYFDAVPLQQSTAAVEVADADNLWVTHSLLVKVSLRGSGSFTPTQVKVWGINGVTSESGASWQPMSATITGTLQNIGNEQFVHAKFWDSGSNYLEATSSGVYYTYTAPRLSSSVSWKTAPTDEGSNVGVLTNTAQDTELTLDKSKFIGLLFDSLDIRDFSVGSSGIATTITATSGSQIYQLIRDDASSYIPVEKTFSSTAKVPFIRYNGGIGFSSITKYDRSIKTGYEDKINNVNWNSGTGKFNFDILEFSQYGFAVIDKIVFTLDSSSGGYKDEPISIKVKVTDTSGNAVEGAPITFSTASGVTIGSFATNPVNTDASGIATATLNLDTVGTAYIGATVDGVVATANSRVYCIDTPANLQRSLLTQLEQIRWSAEYSDTIASVNTPSVAEPETPTTSGLAKDVLEHDMNVFRTLIKQIKGTTDWFEDVGTYTDPANTAVPKQLTLSGISGHTLDSKTILISIEADNADAGFTVASGSTGVLITPTDARYADPVDRRGLPIFASTKTAGTYQDIGGIDEVCSIDVIDRVTGVEFKNSSGYVVYGKFHDGSDNSGTGEGTDVFVKFYANNAPYTLTASDPTNIMFVYPFRKVLSSMLEYEWARTDFIDSWEGDAELMADISNLWAFTGAANNTSTPTWDHAGGTYAVASGSALQSAINQLNNTIGNTSYSGTNYITALEDISISLTKLDSAIYGVSNAALAGTGEKYIEDVSSDIVAGTTHYLPYPLTYTPYTTTSGMSGRNMDVYIDGQLLVSSNGSNGVSEDMDYSEVSISGIVFHRDVSRHSNIVYFIRQ